MGVLGRESNEEFGGRSQLGLPKMIAEKEGVFKGISGKLK